MRNYLLQNMKCKFVRFCCLMSFTCLDIFGILQFTTPKVLIRNMLEA